MDDPKTAKSSDEVQIEFEVDAVGKARIELALALMRRTHPEADLLTMFECALDTLLAELEHEEEEAELDELVRELMEDEERLAQVAREPPN